VSAAHIRWKRPYFFVLKDLALNMIVALAILPLIIKPDRLRRLDVMAIVPGGWKCQTSLSIFLKTKIFTAID